MWLHGLKIGLPRSAGESTARLGLVVVGLTAGLLAPAPAAWAATVAVAADGVVVAAGAGERNGVELGGTFADVAIADRGAPLAAGPGCRSLADGRVGCTAPEGRPFLSFRLELGDGDDRVVAAVGRPAASFGSSPIFDVRGGPGSDHVDMTATLGLHRLDGGDGGDVLMGGPYDDELIGGAGADHLAGQDGEDTLQGDGEGEPAADDRLDGGTGRDAARYDERREAVEVSLGEAAAQGSAGERDAFVSIEGASGGAGDDRLEGGATDDRLYGRGGDDELLGHSGADSLSGGGGRDRLAGGPGGDYFVVAAGDRARGGAGRDDFFAYGGSRVDGGGQADRVTSRGGRVTCGRGSDTVFVARPSFLARDCEEAGFGEFQPLTLLLPLRRASSRLTFRARCAREFVNEEDGSGPDVGVCDGRARVRSGRRLLAGGPYSARARRVMTNRLTLTPAGRAARRGVRVRVTLHADGLSGSSRRFSFDTQL